MLLDAVSRLPFGALNWYDTSVEAMRIGDKGKVWIEMPAPTVADGTTRRRAQLRLGDDGVLAGTVAVDYLGHEAHRRRMQLRQEDDEARRKALEAELKAHLPASATVKLVQQPDWEAIDAPLQVQFEISVPDWAVASGARLLAEVGLFGTYEKDVFVTSERKHPLYFTFPFQFEDEVHLALPAGYRLQSAPPPPPASPEPLLQYSTAVERDGDNLVLRRKLLVGVLLAQAAITRASAPSSRPCAWATASSWSSRSKSAAARAHALGQQPVADDFRLEPRLRQPLLHFLRQVAAAADLVRRAGVVEQQAIGHDHARQLFVERQRVQLAGDAEARRVVQDGVHALVGDLRDLLRDVAVGERQPRIAPR